MTPKQSIMFEIERRSRHEVVRDYVAILDGGTVDDEVLFVLGGPNVRIVLEGREGGVDGYWRRVWAARGLLHVWDATAAEAIIAATTHAHWHVREMSAKVIARHRVTFAIDAVVTLLDDDNARVRAAAGRAFNAVAAP